MIVLTVSHRIRRKLISLFVVKDKCLYEAEWTLKQYLMTIMLK